MWPRGWALCGRIQLGVHVTKTEVSLLVIGHSRLVTRVGMTESMNGLSVTAGVYVLKQCSNHEL